MNSRYSSTLSNEAGLIIELLSHGCPRKVMVRDITVNLFPGTELEGGLTNLWLRCGGEMTPLLGPNSPLLFSCSGQHMEARGEWGGLRLTLCLTMLPDAPVWAWQIVLHNTTNTPATADLLLVQDVGLTDYASIRRNEFYVSQYLDHTSLEDVRYGNVLAVRQNQAHNGCHPQLLVASMHHGAQWATDAMQIWGLGNRGDDHPLRPNLPLPSQRLQHEHAVVGLQTGPLEVAPNSSAGTGFVCVFQHHHPLVTSAGDLEPLHSFMDRIASQVLPGSSLPIPGTTSARPVIPSLFFSAGQLPVRTLSQSEIATYLSVERRHEEWHHGQLLSFFHGTDTHAVLREKELLVARPHGHILRSGNRLTPDECALTSTCWMQGVFHSMLTQGNVSFNRLLTTQRTWLGLFRAQGLRLFVDCGQGWRLLGLPSSFEMQPQQCRWLYAHNSGIIEIVSRSGLSTNTMELQCSVLRGDPIRVLATLQFAMGTEDGDVRTASVPVTREGNSLRIALPADTQLAREFPEGVFWLDSSSAILRYGDDSLVYGDGASRGDYLVCVEISSSLGTTFTLRPELVNPKNSVCPHSALPLPTFGAVPHMSVRVLADILPWFKHNALVHYLAPRGLEQYTGGAWGTRDVCQGPVEMLLSLGHTPIVRDLLIRTFAQQNPDGDWPQWFMFFPRNADVRAHDSHGDIVFWPLLALARYLRASADIGLLAQPVPFYRSAMAPLIDHVHQALRLIRRRVVSGTHLAAYGHGDWNDSMQPADPALRDQLASSWTVTLHYQTLTALADALHVAGEHDLAQACLQEARSVCADFQRLLVRDGVVAGYGHFAVGHEPTLWIHPADAHAGPHYSLLPLMHAILADMLPADKANYQLSLIEEHLLGPDGARLFDCPIDYSGGVSQRFCRAETASFFGREVGLMYMHAHLRWCQTLAHVGRADAFWRALHQAIPIDLTSRIPGSSLRQSNCYYSSSDAAFPDRYAASLDYAAIHQGRVAFDGGWRVYSSGPGIALGLVVTHLLGLRLEHDVVEIDPVMPPELDGLEAELELGGLHFSVRYRVATLGYGVVGVQDTDGREIPFTRRPHAYRIGPVTVPRPVQGSRVNWAIVLG